MKFRRIFSFRNRVVVIIIGVLLGALSLLYTNNMAQRLKQKEQHDVALWAHAMERVNRNATGNAMADPLIADIVSNSNNIPFIITNENLEVINSHLIPDRALYRGEHSAARAVLVDERPLPHHLLRQVAAAQVALLVPLRAAAGRHALHPAGIHRFPFDQAGRAEPRMDRSGQRDGPPAGHPHLVAAGLDRVPALATRRPTKPWANRSCISANASPAT